MEAILHTLRLAPEIMDLHDVDKIVRIAPLTNPELRVIDAHIYTGILKTRHITASNERF